MDKKTKIICTIADNNCDSSFIQKLYENGMNVVRINSAHASMEGAQKIVDTVRKISDKIGILIDTKGPEIRLNKMADAVGFMAHNGDLLDIRNDVVGLCSKSTLYTTYANIVENVPIGANILIDDGAVDLKVIDKDAERLVCRVMNEGLIKSHKSINIPNVYIDLPALTEKDKKFIEWAIEADIDFVAHSFVRDERDLISIQKILDNKKSHLKIIAKIENRQGFDNLDKILSHCYGVMVARGDLGVEIPVETIPVIQKKIVEHCRKRKKPVIVATQMLQSMIDNPRPSRAEITDVSNAVLQGTDAIMLSGETAFGKYPVEAVSVMTKVAEVSASMTDVDLSLNLDKVVKPIAVVLARSLVSTTNLLPVRAIIFDTYTGRIGRYLSTFRPKVPMYAMCYNSYTARELALVYGITAYDFPQVSDKEVFAKISMDMLIKEGKIKKGDLIGFIGGVFGAEIGSTYMELKYAE